MNDKIARSGYVNVNDLQVYYEVQGTGKPLLLLHGGIATECFRTGLPTLAASRQVISVHLQGHGRTRDVERPFRYEAMADDIAGVLLALDIEKADVLGYSLGGGVALQMAVRHPDRVDHLVVVSAPVASTGWFPEIHAQFGQMVANARPFADGVRARSGLAERYPEVQWEQLFSKIGELQMRPYDWSAAASDIQSPTLLVFADADSFDPAHIVGFYKSLGGGQRDAGLDGSLRSRARLAIVPGASHYDVLSGTAWVGFVSDFLGA